MSEFNGRAAPEEPTPEAQAQGGELAEPTGQIKAWAERYLTALDPTATKFTFQTFTDDKASLNGSPDPLARIFHGSLDDQLPTLVDYNNRGAGVYVAIHETNFKGRSNENIVRIRALPLDLDGAPLEPVLATERPKTDPKTGQVIELKIHIIVETSPARWQTLWCVRGLLKDSDPTLDVEDDLALAEYIDIPTAMSRRFNGDPKVNILPQVMRLPGFYHNKGTPFLVRIERIAADCTPYPAKHFRVPKEKVKTRKTNGSDLNSVALQNLSVWVPVLFGADARPSRRGGYRVSSKALKRWPGITEDLSLDPEGIVDFGVHDTGDRRKGKREPADTVLEWGRMFGVDVGTLPEAESWLTEAIGFQPPKPYVLVRASDVVPRELRWLWTGHMLRGSLGLITGLPGIGKSQLQCDLVARATTGREWPNRTPGGAPCNVIMVTAEDILDQVLVPRLMAAQADCSRVHVLKAIKRDDKECMFLLAEDLLILAQIIEDVGNVGLVTLDPITAYMGKVDSHRTTDVRGQLGPLAALAETKDVVVSAITHPAKASSQRAIDHFIGSQAFIAAARIGHLCVEQDEDQKPIGRILFANAKNNPHPKMPTLAYRARQVAVCQDEKTGGTIVAPCVTWEADAVPLTADQAIAATTAKKKDEATKLLELLLERGSVAVKTVEEQARGHGLTMSQMHRAKAKMGCVVAFKEEGPDGGWIWKVVF